MWRATLTPDGPATVRISHATSRSPQAHTYGEGAEWLAARAHDLYGLSDSIPFITARHDTVATAQRTFGQLPMGRSHVPYHELLPAVLGQRVTGLEAHREWNVLVRRHGCRAPGPVDDLWVPPHPDELTSLPYTTLHTYGIEKKRADALRAVAKHAHFLHRLAESSLHAHELTQKLQLIPGVGVWTAAVAGGLAFGDPDALQVGDFHVKNTVAYALTGAIRGTDEEMIQSMAPYAGHRHRVVRWLQLSGMKAPARGPRQRIVSITRL